MKKLNPWWPHVLCRPCCVEQYNTQGEGWSQKKRRVDAPDAGEATDSGAEGGGRPFAAGVDPAAEVGSVAGVGSVGPAAGIGPAAEVGAAEDGAPVRVIE